MEQYCVFQTVKLKCKCIGRFNSIMIHQLNYNQVKYHRVVLNPIRILIYTFDFDIGMGMLSLGWSRNTALLWTSWETRHYWVPVGTSHSHTRTPSSYLRLCITWFDFNQISFCLTSMSISVQTISCLFIRIYIKL